MMTLDEGKLVWVINTGIFANQGFQVCYSRKSLAIHAIQSWNFPQEVWLDLICIGWPIISKLVLVIYFWDALTILLYFGQWKSNMNNFPNNNQASTAETLV